MIARLLISLTVSSFFLNCFEKKIESQEIYSLLTQDCEWVNTPVRYTAKDLKNRILLLDFWTYACVNCFQAASEIEHLKKEFGPSLTVIGIHSAKFLNERETRNIKAAIDRYEIRHPVINDWSFTIWDKFGIRAWPSFVLINPDGKVIKKFEGEGEGKNIKNEILKLKASFKGKIEEKPLLIDAEVSPQSPLKFPNKITFAQDIKTIFISDTGNNRILATDLTGKIKYALSGFHQPHGLLYHKNSLIVADTKNHQIKQVDLKTKNVTVLAGTGFRGHTYHPQNKPAIEVPLASPWALESYKSPDLLAVAMAGLHQIWVYDFNSKQFSVLAGNGTEAMHDGKYPMNALAQPSALSFYDDKLYFLDAESSSLRVLHDRFLTTIIGKGLFEFGFSDGLPPQAQLQHPQGLSVTQDGAVIADTFNHALRLYNFKTRVLSTLSGQGRSGFKNGNFKEALFNEPSGVIRIKNSYFVTDTNNHQIRVVNLINQKVTSLNIR